MLLTAHQTAKVKIQLRYATIFVGLSVYALTALLEAVHVCIHHQIAVCMHRVA